MMLAQTGRRGHSHGGPGEDKMQRLMHDTRGNYGQVRGPGESGAIQYDCVPMFGRSRFFQGVAPELLRQLAADGTRKRVARDTELFRQDDPSSALLMILEGNVKLIYLTPEGGQVVLGLQLPGDLVGCAAVFRKRPYPATAVAASDAVVISWHASYIFDAIAGIPQLSSNALAIVSDRADEFMSRMREMAQEPVDRRLARNLLRIVEKQAAVAPGEAEARDVSMSRRDLADLCGTTLFTVSRILQVWERAGIVRCGRRRVGVLNPDRLRGVAAGAGIVR
jgi:CRP-like cAMP-binding protein